MILKGNQRAGAKDLAFHLMKDENDHVDVHELRDFSSETLMGALNEVYAISRGTKCRQYLFSLSLNPPPNEKVATTDFDRAIDHIEEKLGLSGQPRAIVFHEKEGRRHAHAVWSRIKVDEMKAVQLSFTHRTLQSISRDLYLEHGWKMPKGLVDGKLRDPRNFTLAEWQQAKRQDKDPRIIKTALQDAWAISDSKAAFEHALSEQGFYLARGDRRGFVIVDYEGEVYSIPKWVGVKTKDVRVRLGDEQELESVADAKCRIAQDMLPVFERLQNENSATLQRAKKDLAKQRQALVAQHRQRRKSLKEKIERRRIEEIKIRQRRFRAGLKGLWDRLCGEHKRICLQNEQEATAANLRDQEEFDTLVFRQINQRRVLSTFWLERSKTFVAVRRRLEKEQDAVVDKKHKLAKERKLRRE